MKYALLLMGRTQDPDCGEDGGADPEEFMAFDKEISEAGIALGQGSAQKAALRALDELAGDPQLLRLRQRRG